MLAHLPAENHTRKDKIKSHLEKIPVQLLCNGPDNTAVLLLVENSTGPLEKENENENRPPVGDTCAKIAQNAKKLKLVQNFYKV
ncbi:hypothetical protein T4C_3851 [Trichinella pseudospiralis]|uniref:Uncharacterized protein n=1 Tax=Trichinella pseudospiralis TaxID=6337 RepID=A0A0V1I6U3_TRIPS|nr:hypothetical protein T4C_3851 [Trichinella pseudospiralis]